MTKDGSVRIFGATALVTCVRGRTAAALVRKVNDSEAGEQAALQRDRELPTRQRAPLIEQVTGRRHRVAGRLIRVERLEWWPDYDRAPLWLRTGRGGTPANLPALGLDPELESQIVAWGALYTDDKLPVDGPGDPQWMATGVDLLARVRTALAGSYEVIVTEPWWGEAPCDL